MPRILGVDVPDNKRLEISLTYVYGIGNQRASAIIKKLRLDPNMRANKLTEEEIAKIASAMQEYEIEGDLRRKTQNDIKRLISIHSYRGTRHKSGQPVRGQRTRTNARTRKGKRKTVATNKPAVAKK